jgi:hypothetical protein
MQTQQRVFNQNDDLPTISLDELGEKVLNDVEKKHLLSADDDVFASVNVEVKEIRFSIALNRFALHIANMLCMEVQGIEFYAQGRGISLAIVVFGVALVMLLRWLLRS